MKSSRGINGNILRTDKEPERSTICQIWEDARWVEKKIACHSFSPFGDIILHLSDGTEIIIPKNI